MELFTVNAGYFKLDGGSMFGIVPKSLWEKVHPADDRNLCTWMARSLLIKEEGRLILIDTGLGNKQSEKFFSRYQPSGPGPEHSLNELGFSADDITDVFLTHLHFDHCGGAIVRREGDLIPAFRNAVYWSNREHWEWAMHPNIKEQGSFLKENFSPLKDAGKINFIPSEEAISFTKNISVRFVSGHTRAMMLPQIRYGKSTLVFMADLLPSVYHIRLPWIMAYDINPLLSLQEKESFLEEALEKDYILYFEHDPDHECCRLKRTEKGIQASDIFTLKDI